MEMKTMLLTVLTLSVVVALSGCINDTSKHICTDEEKQAQICTLDYTPVCGTKGEELPQTYGNGCQACSDGVDYWEEGECSYTVSTINSFEECVATDYPVMESYPRQCAAEGKTFVEEHCTSGEYTLTLETAKQIASESECGDAFKDTYVCNEFTGTYWIDLDMEREGCNPACVINLETREAEINWRCTGLVQ